MTIVPVTLDGAELAVGDLTGGYAAVRNDGTEMIWFSGEAGISPEKRGVTSLAAGQSSVCPIEEKTVYILGTGKATVVSSGSPENPFKSSAQGGSGADGDAGTALNEHTENADIHVTAAEKTAWNAKAELSDIPAALPADGGNADTLDGKQATAFVEREGTKFVTIVPYNLEWQGTHYAVIADSPDIQHGFYVNNNTSESLTFNLEVKRISGTAFTAQTGYGTGTYPDMPNTGKDREFYNNFTEIDERIITLEVPAGRTGYTGFYTDDGSAFTAILPYISCVTEGYLATTGAGFAQDSYMLDGKRADSFALADELSALAERVAALEASV